MIRFNSDQDYGEDYHDSNIGGLYAEKELMILSNMDEIMKQIVQSILEELIVIDPQIAKITGSDSHPKIDGGEFKNDVFIKLKEGKIKENLFFYNNYIVLCNPRTKEPSVIFSIEYGTMPGSIKRQEEEALSLLLSYINKIDVVDVMSTTPLVIEKGGKTVGRLMVKRSNTLANHAKYLGSRAGRRVYTRKLTSAEAKIKKQGQMVAQSRNMMNKASTLGKIGKGMLKVGKFVGSRPVGIITDAMTPMMMGKGSSKTESFVSTVIHAMDFALDTYCKKNFNYYRSFASPAYISPL